MGTEEIRIRILVSQKKFQAFFSQLHIKFEISGISLHDCYKFLFYILQFKFMKFVCSLFH